MPANELTQKYETLLKNLAKTEGAVIAFSGGVDSTLLLYAAREALGDNMMAATISTPYIPEWEIREAEAFASAVGVRHTVLRVPFIEELRTNPPDHCYTCKRTLFQRLWDWAKTQGFSHLMEGTNVDDLGDYRPGLKALTELNVESPLKDAGLTKQDIRDLSRRFDLPTWDKPSFACLLSRMEIGKPVTGETLKRVEAAEVFLMQAGFPAVRVRNHGDVARIEVPQDRIQDVLAADALHNINSTLKELGYRHVAVDLAGYSMGSLNRPATEKE